MSLFFTGRMFEVFVCHRVTGYRKSCLAIQEVLIIMGRPVCLFELNMSTAKDKILDAAASMFYDQGINSTGINSIIALANVAKMSLYNHFPTKADLVSAYIAARHQEWLDLYAKRAVAITTPISGVLAVFDAYQDHAECEYENGFRGCGLLNAAAEFGANRPERHAVNQHKQEVEAILATHVRALAVDEAQVVRLSLLLSYLLEGAITRAGLEGNSAHILNARAMAQTLLAAEVSP